LLFQTQAYLINGLRINASAHPPHSTLLIMANREERFLDINPIIFAIARSIYNNLPADMLLWERVDDFVPLDAARAAAALSP
jgi:hypothetical protein